MVDPLANFPSGFSSLVEWLALFHCRVKIAQGHDDFVVDLDELASFALVGGPLVQLVELKLRRNRPTNLQGRHDCFLDSLNHLDNSSRVGLQGFDMDILEFTGRPRLRVDLLEVSIPIGFSCCQRKAEPVALSLQHSHLIGQLVYFGAAIDFMRQRWRGFVRFCHDGPLLCLRRGADRCHFSCSGILTPSPSAHSAPAATPAFWPLLRGCGARLPHRSGMATSARGAAAAEFRPCGRPCPVR